MRRFAVLHAFFQNISERATSEVVQSVALLLCFPCFHISNLAFQILYALRQRKLVCLSIKCARLRGEDSVIEFDDLVLQKGSIAQVYCRLRYIAGRLEPRSMSSCCSMISDSTSSGAADRQLVVM